VIVHRTPEPINSMSNISDSHLDLLRQGSCASTVCV
jgi:hypothetical protein